MKFSAIALIAAASSIAASAPAFANSGSATVTQWRALYVASTGAKTSTAITVSNVSASDVTVTLRLYDKEGDPIGSPGFGPVVQANGFTSCNTTNNVCTLPAGQSADFWIGWSTADVDTYGHGKIEWSSTDPVASALVAGGNITHTLPSEGVQRRTLVITRDQPF